MPETSSVTAHGVCRGVPGMRSCAKRTWLTLPGRLCDRCVSKILARMTAEIEKMENDDQ